VKLKEGNADDIIRGSRRCHTHLHVARITHITKCSSYLVIRLTLDDGINWGKHSCEEWSFNSTHMLIGGLSACTIIGMCLVNSCEIRMRPREVEFDSRG
jgi:hypothetical protein